MSPLSSMNLLAWLEEVALPLWWARGADAAGGGFFEALDAEAKPVLGARRARVVCRQIYVYASAWTHLGRPEWREAAQHGVDYLNRHFLREDGLIAPAVTAEHRAVAGPLMLYDQAFCLLALASAAKAGLEPGMCEDQALRLADRLLAEWRHPAGGFVENQEERFQTNPHMHLLEAVMAWAEISPKPIWSAIGAQIVELARDRFIDPVSGALREFFDEHWANGRRVEPGHQFEWSWLLSRWARAHEDSGLAETARRLYGIGRNHGIDEARGLAFDALTTDLAPVNLTARLWPQTEWLKAATLQWAGSADPESRAYVETEIHRAAQALGHYLDRPGPGLWLDKIKADGAVVDEPSPASSFYHIACALFELKTGGVSL